MIAFANTIVFVDDVERSKRFYADGLGLRITKDFGTLVIFGNGFAIHNAESLTKTIFGENAQLSGT